MTERIVLLIDESGSMHLQKRNLVDGVQSFLQEQKKVAPDENDKIKVTIVKFNSKVSDPVELPLGYANFADDNYNPKDQTALYEAIGKTVERYKEEENVIFIVATDGEENASSPNYSIDNIKILLEKCQESKNWRVVYLCENIDQFKKADSMGMTKSSNIKLDAGQLGSHLCSKVFKDEVTKYRTSFSSNK